MGKETFFHQQLQGYIVITLIANAAFIAAFCGYYTLEAQRLEKSQQARTQAVASMLGFRVREVQEVFESLAPLTAETKGDADVIRRLINNHVTRAGHGLRVAWTDADMMLRVGTLISLLGTDKQTAIAPIDLSHRDYVKAARATPGTLVISGINPHAVTGRDFFAFAMGVEEESGNYLGCLATIVDIPQFKKLLASLINGPDSAMEITLPNGDVLFSHQPEQISSDDPVQNVDSFGIKSSVSAFAMRELRQAVFKQGMIWILVMNSVLVGVGVLLYRFYLRPLRELAATFLTLPMHLEPDVNDADSEVSAMVKRAKHIADLLVAHHGGELASKEERENLRLAIAHIDHLNVEQLTFLSTVGAEMEDTFTAIRRYAAFLEGGLEEDYYHTDAIFLENLKDAAQNLKFLSNAFYLMCLQKAGNYHAKYEDVSLYRLARQTLGLFNDAMEFRHVTVEVNSHDIMLKQDAAIIRHVLWGISFLMVRYVDDSARITISIDEKNDGTVQVLAIASACLAGHLADVDANMETFFPESLSKTAMLEDAISSHVDFMVVDHLLTYFCDSPTGLHVKAESHQNGEVSFKIGFSLFQNAERS